MWHISKPDSTPSCLLAHVFFECQFQRVLENSEEKRLPNSAYGKKMKIGEWGRSSSCNLIHEMMDFEKNGTEFSKA